MLLQRKRQLINFTSLQISAIIKSWEINSQLKRADRYSKKYNQNFLRIWLALIHQLILHNLSATADQIDQIWIWFCSYPVIEVSDLNHWGENSKLLFSHFVAIISTHFKCQTVGEIPWSLILDNRAKV